MAKIITKRKKKRLNIYGYITLLFTFCVILSFVTKIFVHTNTARLVREIEKNKIVVERMTDEKEKLVREVNAMGDYANIVEKAQSSGLTHNIDNSYFVNKGD
ncbi:MAG TPA: hypothetical protein VFC75_01880 [Erysipelothrix sp.]|nr:hypothetical protein [Erysipelothrix sp.]